jgi:pyruvate dehydrogenase E1 component beta subunit
MPTTPYDAKGLLIAAVEDDNPVIFIEHRWLHNIFGPVPEEKYKLPIGKAHKMQEGEDLTIVASSYMSLEALRAAEILADNDQISAEIIDLRSIQPWDETMVLASVKKTGRLLVVDGAWRSFGVSAEIVAQVSEKAHAVLKTAPVRVAFPDVPTPTSWALANHYYPKSIDIVNAAGKMFNLPERNEADLGISHEIPLDVPDKAFTGPF